jgi:hypothetical protein
MLEAEKLFKSLEKFSGKTKRPADTTRVRHENISLIFLSCA